MADASPTDAAKPGVIDTRSSRTSISSIVSHRIPHRLTQTALLTPTTCHVCKKFIWGLYRQAIMCTECDYHYHADCEANIIDDCGLTMEMLVGVLTGVSLNGSPTASRPSYAINRSDSTKKINPVAKIRKDEGSPTTDKKDIIQINKHEFRYCTYVSPTWCGVCKNFIWGITKQGYKCCHCQLNVHSGCVSKTPSCGAFLSGGTLTVVSEGEKKPKLETDQIKKRRTSELSKQTKFKKESQFRLNKPRENSFLANSIRSSLVIAPSQVQHEVELQTESDDEFEDDSDGRSSMDAIPAAEERAKEIAGAAPAPAAAVPPMPALLAPPTNQSISEQTTVSQSSKSVSSAEHDRSAYPNVQKMRTQTWAAPPTATSSPSTVSALSVDSLEECTAALDAPPDWADLEGEIMRLANQKFEDYRIEHDSLLGSGQFGQVKLAWHLPTKQKMAVKIIDKRKFWGKKPDSTRHLKREIAILGRLKHPGVITLYAVFDDPQFIYMFMELVEGGDLLAYVEKKGRLKEDEAKFIFHQLACGVKYLHDHGIIHRDLKPENLLLNNEDNVKRLKIGDFGFANILGKKAFLHSIVGTPAYVAPEILNRNSRGYAKGADMWSVGVILYACLSGVFPFEEDEPVEDQIKAGKFHFPDEYWVDVSDEAIDLVCNLLVVDPRQRYTVDDMLKHPWFSTTRALDLQ